jgi:hypothetical protein
MGWSHMEPATWIDKGRNLIRLGHWFPFGKIEVHSNPESMTLLARCHRGIERHSIGKKRRAGHDALAVSVQNSPVHVFRQSKIVRVYDELFHKTLTAVAVSKS